MEMRFLVITLAAVAIGAQCRSITLSNSKDAEKESAACMSAHRSARVHRDANQDASLSTRTTSAIAPHNSSNLADERADAIAPYEEDLTRLVELAGKIGEDKNATQQEMQFLNQLGTLIAQFIGEQPTYAELDVINTLRASSGKKAAGSVDVFNDILNTVKELDVYQDGEITDEHIRIKRSAEGYEGAASFAISNNQERLNSVLTDFQRELVEIRRYLSKLCKKHNLTPATISEEAEPEDDTSPDQAAEQVPII